MKGKGYRSSVCQGNLDRDRASGGSGSCEYVQHMFVMIYQTGIRLDDRGKSYIQNQKHLRNRSAIPEVSDILVSLAAQDDINYLKNAGSSAVIDLAEFEEKGNHP